MLRLRKRAEFLAVAKGRRVHRRPFVIQALRRAADGKDAGGARFGYTVTRKTGNAVERNRIRRRLREVVRLHGANKARSGFDYVLIGRSAALSMPFERLAGDLGAGLDAIHVQLDKAEGPDGTASSADKISPENSSPSH